MRKAFTLAEILITLGIIGVVAALTVPNIYSNYQQEALTAQLRKIISEIESAFDLSITSEGKTTLSGTRIARDGIDEKFIDTYFKYIKKCKDTDTAKCFASEQYFSINGKKKDFKCAGYSYVLANSSAICMNIVKEIPILTEDDEDSGKFKQLKGLNIEIFIDTNGNQPPNVGGRDMFHVYMMPDGRIQDHANIAGVCITQEDGNVICERPEAEDIYSDCESSPFGDGCLAKIMDNNWKMEY